MHITERLSPLPLELRYAKFKYVKNVGNCNSLNKLEKTTLRNYPSFNLFVHLTTSTTRRIIKISSPLITTIIIVT